ncbi:hypothetical protein [Desulfovibrio litoralis]|uniref:Uncharacterized protein n=1 Tax=Desulfovibrio litoralis DSM 11393 TaxID=1121455 RepID=A0A1M7SDD7_9BACT|nr:hypothetical protein [Desulfovibrio litoralis]SHN56478.1 hypothetical protein SAMN02745728_00796 [Desulfovibrio litoralis DSM 11393]
MGFFSNLFKKKETKNLDQTNDNKQASVQNTDQNTVRADNNKLLTPPTMDESSDFKMVMEVHPLAGNLCIALPVEWVPFESDRFRAKNADGSVLVSVSVFSISPEQAASFSSSDYIQDQRGLFQRFVDEGGYEPYDDFHAEDTFVMQSFKVDEETQYYLHMLLQADELYLINIIIRNVGDYSLKMRTTIQAIKMSIAPC